MRYWIGAAAALWLPPCGGEPSHPAPPNPACMYGGGEGQPCGCPGSSDCPLGQNVSLKCSDSGVWEKTDQSCVLGLNCRASTDCASGQVCCGDPFTGSWGNEITSSSCQVGPCPTDLVQLCRDTGDCAQPGSACGATWSAFDGGSVLGCSGVDAN